MIDEIITRYQEFTGRTLPEGDIPVYKAWALRAVQILENKLGWSLIEDANVIIAGTSKHGCDCSDSDDLSDAPEIIGKAKIFNYNKAEKFIRIDPFLSIHKVYICRNKTTETASETPGKTVVVLDEVKDFVPRYFDSKFGRFLDACKGTHCAMTCATRCQNCVSILVDADWVTLETVPDSLLGLIFDFLDWMANGGYSQSGVSKESVDGHSVEYKATARSSTPLDDPANASIISRFAGPYGNTGLKFIR